MDIIYGTSKLAKEFNDFKTLKRRHGERRARIIRRRQDDMKAADSMEVLRNAPGRYHELGGNLNELLSVDLDGPYRLLFRVANDPTPRKPDGGLDWSRITVVEVMKVEDTHE